MPEIAQLELEVDEMGFQMTESKIEIAKTELEKTGSEVDIARSVLEIPDARLNSEMPEMVLET